MRASRKSRAAAVVVVAVAAFATGGSVASAAAVTVQLCAVPGTVAPLPTTSPGTTVPIWGFGIPVVPGNCATAVASLPGPQITVVQGDTVTLSVTNALPAGHTISVETPGIAFAAGPTDAAPGATVTRTFTASAAGTFLYQSGGDAGRQVAMGLYGVILVRPSAVPSGGADPNPAHYGLASAASLFDVEAPLVLSQVDSSFNTAEAAGTAFDMHTYSADYWLINGRAYPDTVKVTATAGQRVLLRYLNAGYDNTTMLLLGMHERVLARDAALLTNPFDVDAETIPAGATEDTLAVVPAGGAPSASGFALYNRQLHLTNGPVSSPLHNPGGMLTFVGP